MRTQASSLSGAFPYFLEKSNKGLWAIDLTPAVKLAKRYFEQSAFGFESKDVVAKIVGELLQNDTSHETRVMVHMSLFLHSNHPDVEEMSENEGLRQLAPSYSEPVAISSEDYNWLVAELGFDPDFVYKPTAAAVDTLSEAQGYGSNEMRGQVLEELSTAAGLAVNADKGRRNEIIRQTFRDGIHGSFEIEHKDQTIESMLGSVRMRMRCIPAMTETERQIFVDEIYALAFQAPIWTTMILVNGSVRTKNFYLLHELQIFLDLPIGRANSNARMPPETRLFEFALYKTILQCDQTSPLWHFCYTGLLILVQENFIQLSKLMDILKNVIQEFGNSDQVENSANAIKLFRCVLSPFLEQDKIPSEELVQHKVYLANLLRATFLADQSLPVNQPRGICFLLIQLINEKLSDRLGTDESALLTAHNNSTVELGLIYIRCPEHRPAVEKLLQEQSGDPKWAQIETAPRTVKELTGDVITLVTASSRLELEGVVKFMRVLVHNKPVLIREFGFYRYMNRVLSSGFQSRSVRTSKFLGFFSSYLEFIERDEGDQFAAAYEDHLEIFKTLLSLMFGIYKVADGAAVKLGYSILRKKARVSGRIFEILYDLVEWVHGRHIVYPAEIKEQIWEAVTLVPTFVQTNNAQSGYGTRYKKALEYLNEM